MILFYSLDSKKIYHFLFTFQFHYDLILFTFSAYNLKSSDLFQFHYDLILLHLESMNTIKISTFQFHYDLILFIS